MSELSSEELRAQLRAAEVRERQELEERRKAFKVQFSYTIRVDKSRGTFEKIYDPSCVRYRIGRECLNRSEAEAVGYQDYELNDGGMDYIYNIVTHRIICSTGGGTCYISEGWKAFKEHADGADDWAFEQIGQYLVTHPEGGDITDIVEAYQKLRAPSQKGTTKRS